MSSQQSSSIGSPCASALDEISLTSQISDITSEISLSSQISNISSTSPRQQTYVPGSRLPKYMVKEDLDIMRGYYTLWVPEGSLYLPFIPKEVYQDICKAMRVDPNIKSNITHVKNYFKNRLKRERRLRRVISLAQNGMLSLTHNG